MRFPDIGTADVLPGWACLQRWPQIHANESATRLIAGCFRFFTLIQFGDRPARQQRWAAIAPKRNGPSARGRAGAVEVVFRGAQKHRQSIQRIALGPKTPIRVSTSHRDGLPSFGRLYTLSAGGFDHYAAECENLTVNCRRAQVRSLGGSRSLLDQTRETGLAFALLVTLGLAAG